MNNNYGTNEIGCWIWLGAKSHGYGAARHNGKNCSAHRVMYEELVGPIPNGLEINHLCRVKNCVNPEHLEPVTHRENCLRILRTIKEFCINGHKRWGTRKDGRSGYPIRYCLECHRLRSVKRNAKAKEDGKG